MSSEGQPKRPKAADAAGAVLILGVLAAQAFLDVSGARWLTAVAVALLLLAPAFIFLPFLHLSRYGKPRDGGPYFATTKLVDRGIYRVVRHPQYVGYALLAVGFGARNPHPLVLGLASGAAAFFYLQCVLEERFCRGTFGSAYDQYMSRVPRFNFLLGLFRIAQDHLRGVNGSTGDEQPR
ncbi:MAG: hypothetical protein GTO22_07715 [Gemmatimonadales bacterium]|nr:hypothetical protein [Gemmatimonadales bacterium]